MNTKILRQKILDLAIRGKLVPQNSSDEPVSVLLERIRQQKQQMLKEGKLKPKEIKDDTIIFIGEDNLHYEKMMDDTIVCIEDEDLFDLPDGWAFLRLQSFITFIGGSQPPKSTFEYSQTPDNIRLIQIRDYKTDKFATYIPRSLARRFCNKNDVMIGRYGPPIFQILRGLEGSYNVALMKAVANPHIMDNDYLYYLLQDGELLKMLEYLSDRTCGQDGINMYELNRYVVGIPPMNEQKRIVNYLEKILPIVDSIASEKEQLSFLVKITKNKVLDLAIRGQLVSQDLNDEPASVLLERIRAKKETSHKSRNAKKDKQESIIIRGDDNSYYLQNGEMIESLEEWDLNDLPDSWAICCLGEICDYGNCINVDTDNIDDDAWILDLEDIEKDTGRVLEHVKKKDRPVSSTKHQFHTGQVLYSKLRPYLNKVVLSDQDGFCTSEILPLEFEDIVLPEYARFYLMSPTFLKYANRCSYGVKMPRLGTTDGKKAIVPLPPYNEQVRIVRSIHTVFSQLNAISKSLC